MRLCRCHVCRAQQMMRRFWVDMSERDRGVFREWDRGQDLNAPPVEPIGQATGAEDGMSIGELEAESISDFNAKHNENRAVDSRR